MESKQLQKIVEGALLAAGRPVTVNQISDLFGLEGAQPTKEEIRAALEDIATDCADRGYELKQVASGYRFQVRQELSPWIGRLWEEKPQKYSRALLETLAIIAYRQPMTRGEIEEIRGVSVSSNITKTLLEREWVRVVGHRDVPGKPALYATTKQFLDYFNLKRLDELPTLNEIRDLAELEPELEFAGEESGVSDGQGPVQEHSDDESEIVDAQSISSDSLEQNETDQADVADSESSSELQETDLEPRVSTLQ